MLKTGVLLVGGASLRLRPLTDDIPKCMIEVGNRLLIDWLLEWLKENGIENVILGVDYKKEVLMNYVNDGRRHGLKVKYSIHTGAEGTGDAFKLAIENCNVEDENFLAMNGDTLTDISLKNLYRFHKEHSPIATIVTAPFKSPFGIIEIDENNTITNFKERPILSDRFINSGIYIFNKEIKKHLPQKGNIEETTFVELTKQGKLKSFKYFGFWNTLNTHKDLEIMKKAIGNYKI